jgi:hypothetical protein
MNVWDDNYNMYELPRFFLVEIFGLDMINPKTVVPPTGPPPPPDDIV